jgi:hypothetical protein
MRVLKLSVFLRHNITLYRDDSSPAPSVYLSDGVVVTYDWIIFLYLQCFFDET